MVMHMLIIGEHGTDASTKAILPYLTEEFGFPSAKGHEVWAQYVTDYFVAK